LSIKNGVDEFNKQNLPPMYARINYCILINRHKAWDTMVRAADLGNPDAQLRVAFAKLAGIYFPQNPEVSKEVFVKLGEQGHPEAQFGLGFLYATGTLVNSSQSQALLYYTFAAFGGSSWAQMALGYRYWSGMHTDF
jgi:SEL1 protein